MDPHTNMATMYRSDCHTKVVMRMATAKFLAGWYKGRFLDLYRKAKKLNEKCFPRGRRNSRKKLLKYRPATRKPLGSKKKAGDFCNGFLEIKKILHV